MKTDIYYFSATGNCLSIARKLAEQIGDSRIFSIPNVINKVDSISGDRIGIVSPIYMYNVPYLVVDFIKKIKQANYAYMVFGGAGGLGIGLKVTKKLFAAQNVKLSALFNIPMPDNYTPYGYVPEEKQKKLLANADKKVEEIVKIVKANVAHFDGTNTSLIKTYIHPGIFYKMGYNRINILDNSFYTDENCNGCSICQKVCPVNNITMKDNKPVWNNQCQQCYACLQWCPKASIQAGEKTVGIKRYNHPNITVKDIIKSSKEGKE